MHVRVASCVLLASLLAVTRWLCGPRQLHGPFMLALIVYRWHVIARLRLKRTPPLYIIFTLYRACTTRFRLYRTVRPSWFTLVTTGLNYNLYN